MKGNGAIVTADGYEDAFRGDEGVLKLIVVVTVQI